MKYTLREKQVEASDAGLKSMLEGKGNGFIYASCGFGKSLVIADMASKLKEPVLVLQPQKELVEQNYEKMMTYGIEDVSIYSASLKKKDFGQITFATIGSIYKKPEEFKHYKYVLKDECHKINPKNMQGMYAQFLKAIGSPPSIGLTGSPFRTEGKYKKEQIFRNGREETELYYTTVLTPLNRIFNKDYKKTGTSKFVFGSMVYKAEMAEQIDLGHLCKPEYISNYSGGFDYSNLKVNTTGADFDQAALDDFLSSKDRVKNIIQSCADYDSICNLNLIFCGSIRQALNLTEMSKKFGLKADYITGAHSPKERKRIYESFKYGDIKHLFNVGVMRTGIDIPWMDLVTQGTPTMSVDYWVQGAARVIRKDPNNPGKIARINDICNVHKRLGKIENIRMDKEDGFKDIIVNEYGQLSGRPLSKFRMENI